jgi:hypothetical protein
MHKEMRGNAISFPTEAFHRKFRGIKTDITTETEVKCIIYVHSLKARHFWIMME